VWEGELQACGQLRKERRGVCCAVVFRQSASNGPVGVRFRDLSWCSCVPPREIDLLGLLFSECASVGVCELVERWVCHGVAWLGVIG